MSTYHVYGSPQWPPIAAFAAGLRSLGRAVSFRDHNAYHWRDESPDAAVIYGMRAHGRDIAAFFAARGTPTVVIDHGYMKRVHTAADAGHGHFYVGMGKLGWTPASAPPDRFDALKVAIAAPAGGPIRRALICGQVAYDASHHLSGAELTALYERLAGELQRAGIADVRFRAHPLGNVDPYKVAVTRSREERLEDALAAADVVASINSNAGLDAILAGKPAITLAPAHYGELAYRWPVHLGVVEVPPEDTVKAFLARLAYSQWTAAEMRAAAPHRYLIEEGLIP